MPASDIGAEIRQLTTRGPSTGPQKGRRYGRRQALAAALSMARRGDFGPRVQRRIKKRSRRRP